MATYLQAGKAKQALSDQLTTIFNSLVNSPINGIGIGLGKNGNDYIVKANLKRQPTKEEASLLPKKSLGVKVKYEFVGTVKAA